MRRAFKAPLVAMLLLVLILAQQVTSVLAADPAQTPPLPPSRAPKPVNPGRVYFPDCGHTLSEGFLYYFRVNGRDDIFGCPISEEIGQTDGKIVQYFKKGRLEYNPQLAGTDWEIVPSAIVKDYLTSYASTDELNNPAYKPIAPFNSTADKAYFDVTKHSISGGFYKFWKTKGGLKAFGLPLSEEYPLPINGVVYAAQDFERVRLIYSSKTGVQVANMGERFAEVTKTDTSRVVQEADVPNFDTWLWEHWVDVNLSKQSETFYEGDVPIWTALVTTGKPGYDTPTGTYYINTRVYNEHMTGGQGTDDYYDLYNVLYTQYFTYQGHALHYAWWRSVFGVTGSHGCVNQDYATSEFAWYFMTIGSRVQIHY